MDSANQSVAGPLAEAAYLITGIPGAGKTTVARQLARRFHRAAHIEGDLLQEQIVAGARLPGPEYDAEADRQLRLRDENAALLVNSYAAAGFMPIYETVVVRRSHLERIRSLIRVRPLHVFVLAPELNVALERDRTRTAKVLGDTWAFLDAILRKDLTGEGTWLDTSNEPAGVTVDRIIAHTRMPDGGNAPAGQEAADRFRSALRMHDFGVAVMRQNLWRRMPEASEAEIKAALGTWLRSKTMLEHDAPDMRAGDPGRFTANGPC